MKKFNFSALMFAALVSVAACTSKPNSDEAKVSDAKEVNAEAQTDASVLTINTADSKVLWVGTKPTGQHNGTIDIEKGSLKTKNGEIVGGEIVIDLTTTSVEDLEGEYKQKLEGHLASADFFDVENHPKATFTITKVTKLEEETTMAKAGVDTEGSEEANEFKVENPTHEVSGNLTLRGTTKNIAFPAKVTKKDGNVMAEARFNIDRTNWNVNHMEESSAVAAGKDKFIHNTVNVGFDITATPSK